MFENSDKILTFVSLRVDVNFETFADAFSLLENSYKFLPILLVLYNGRIGKNFQGAKKHLPRFYKETNVARWEFSSSFQTLWEDELLAVCPYVQV